MIFVNKENFIQDADIYRLLTAFESAHDKNDSFAMAIVLTQLKQKNISIVENKACIENEMAVQ